MSAADTGEADILAAVMKGAGYAWSAASDFYVSLHTSNPGETGDQSTNEIAYTGYARVQVTRATGFSVSSSAGVNFGFNVAAIVFGAMTGGAGGTVTHFGIGTSSTAAAAGRLLLFGTCTNIAVTAGITPQFGADQLRITCD